MKKTVRDIEWAGKTAVCRCDFNVPLEDGRITDDTRIRASLPTISYLVENGAAWFSCPIWEDLRENQRLN